MQPMDTSLTTRAICDKIGRRVVAKRIGVGTTAVGNVVADGLFPARWYKRIQALCRESGIECPDELFNFLDEADQENHGRIYPSDNNTISNGVDSRKRKPAQNGSAPTTGGAA